jgi:hypothetical protein
MKSLMTGMSEFRVISKLTLINLMSGWSEVFMMVMMTWIPLECICPVTVLWSRNFFFRSGSDFQKVSAPEPAPATALELPVFTDFMLKRTFFMFLIKEN